MDETRIIPGDLLVSKGALKLNSSLPEVGLKDASPNGTWLEQKQIQAALEARKHLIEVERIEKSGVLSHAEWCEELMLAEVTQKVGGYWQYLGHNIGKRLFLNPEEALFLMEINCLLVKYNEVTVSLQQAYALMLRSKISLMQYKVYASLSRLGYRVFRHQRQQEPGPKEYEKRLNKACCLTKKVDNLNCENNDKKPVSTLAEEKSFHEIDVDTNKNGNETVLDNIASKNPKELNDIPIEDDSNNHKKNNISKKIIQTVVTEEASTSGNAKKVEMKMNKLKHSKYIQYKINKLKIRKYKAKGSNATHNDYFGNIPEFTKNPVVSITTPDRHYLPSNVHLQNSSYYLNVEKIRTKSTDTDEVPTTSSSLNDSMNTAYPNNIDHLRHPPPHCFRSNNWTEYFNFRFSSQPNPFRHFNFWRPQTSLNYFHFNMTFQRPVLYPQFGPRIIFNPFLQPFMAQNFSGGVSFNSNNGARRKKRSRDILKQEHYASIHRLATFVKNSILELRLSDHNVSKLNHLIQTYNTRYKTRLRLSDDFNVIVDENIIDTIEVDDDEEQLPKKAKTAESPDAFDNNLQRLKQLAYQLKNLEDKNEGTSRHRRMFSSLLKKFNNSYSVDYYVHDNFDVINRNDLTILTSSDIEGDAEITTKNTSRKKLKNPFSILKQLSERNIDEENSASTSSTEEYPFKYSDITLNTFKNEWLPDKSDFGRAEIVSKHFPSEVIDTKREEFLFDFLKIQPDKFKNWLDIKISFLECLQETCELFHYNEDKKNIGLQSLVTPEEFNDNALVLKKLSIFGSDKTTNDDSQLTIDFDVYNRDVQNFRKSNRPLPHFRVVCIKESSALPSGVDVASLHSNYKDNITVLFAVVGVDSVSYVQVNPVDLPVYMSSNINTV